jgi:predicted ATPase
VPAYRLVGVREGVERVMRFDAPMVGRDAELESLRSALRCSTADGRCRLVTVIGEAGVGKSRLIDEFIRSVEGEASVLRGRCLPYGDGITFWPLAEAVRGAADIAERDSMESALQKLAALRATTKSRPRRVRDRPLSIPSRAGARWGPQAAGEIARRQPLSSCSTTSIGRRRRSSS